MFASGKYQISRGLSTYRGYFYLPLFSVMAITFHREMEYHSIIWPLGIIIIMIGIGIRLWATKHIGRRMPWMKKKGKKLVKTGPYAMVRNPLYIGNIVIATGLSILSELIWVIPLVILYLFTLYHLVALCEEKKLTERWENDFLAYMDEVPRWIPKFKNLNEAKEGGFKWIEAIRSEVPSLYVLLFGIFIFVLKGFLSHME